MTTAARRAYPSSTVAAAALATIFFPLISLIAALFLHGREQDPAKRGELRRWAWFSLGWIVLQIVIAVVVAAIVVSSASTSVERSGPCVGGPEPGATGETRPDGTTVFPCAISGTETVRVP